MSYMRWPIYAWTGSACPEDCPSHADCVNCRQQGDVTICEDHLIPDCDNSSHLAMHIWAGKDDERVWDPIYYREEPGEDYPDFVSGVAMNMDLFDQLVIMRYAQLVDEGRVQEVITDFLNGPGHGNFGSWTLLESLGHDPAGDFRRAMDAARERREDEDLPDDDSLP